MSKEARQLGWCSCEEPIVKIYNSEKPTCRTDGTRFVYLKRADNGSCIFRCDKCRAVIDESWSIANGPDLLHENNSKEAQ